MLTPQSDFDSFKILSKESQFYSEFKLKRSNYLFRLKIGMPNSQFDIDTSSNNQKHVQLKKEEEKKKLIAKMHEHIRKMMQAEISVDRKDADCKFALVAALPGKTATIKMNGPIIIGKTWASDAERTKLSSILLFVTKLSNPLATKEKSNVIERLLSSDLGKAFVKASLCVVLNIDPSSCH